MMSSQLDLLVASFVYARCARYFEVLHVPLFLGARACAPSRVPRLTKILCGYAHLCFASDIRSSVCVLLFYSSVVGPGNRLLCVCCTAFTTPLPGAFSLMVTISEI